MFFYRSYHFRPYLVVRVLSCLRLFRGKRVVWLEKIKKSYSFALEKSRVTHMKKKNRGGINGCNKIKLCQNLPNFLSKFLPFELMTLVSSLLFVIHPVNANVLFISMLPFKHQYLILIHFNSNEGYFHFQVLALGFHFNLSVPSFNAFVPTLVWLFPYFELNFQFFALQLSSTLISLSFRLTKQFLHHFCFQEPAHLSHAYSRPISPWRNLHCGSFIIWCST